MATISKGNVFQKFVEFSTTVTITPGSGGSVRFDCSSPVGTTRPEPQTVYAATEISVPGGSTLTAEAVGADATYTDGGEVASLQALVSGYGKAGLGNIGTRMFCGRIGLFTTSASGTTFHTLMALAAKFDAVRLILANASTGGTLTVSKCVVSVPSSMASDSLINNSGATWSGVTFSGSASVTIAAAPGTSRKSYAVSDWLYNIQSKDRVDGGTLPLLAMRAYVASASTVITALGLSSVNVTNWRNHPSGRIVVMRKHDGDAANTPANLVSTTDINQTIIAGVQYLARGKVLTVMAQGDSIMEGQGTYMNEGYALPACLSVQASLGIPVELAQCAASGTTGDTFVYRTEDLIAAGVVPDVLLQALASPNGYTTTFTTAQRDTARALLPRLMSLGKANRLRMVLSTFTPNDTKLWGADDANRIALNSDVAAWPEVNICDASTALSGSVDGTGKTLLASGVSDDGLHPNDAGNALIVPLATAAIYSALAVPA